METIKYRGQPQSCYLIRRRRPSRRVLRVASPLDLKSLKEERSGGEKGICLEQGIKKKARLLLTTVVRKRTSLGPLKETREGTERRLGNANKSRRGRGGGG